MRALVSFPGLHRVPRGAEVALEAVADGLAVRGHDVRVFGTGADRADRSYRYTRLPAVSRDRFRRWPAVPLLRGGTGGLLDYSTRVDVENEMALARQAQAGRLDEIANLPLEEIRANPDLDRFAVAGGRSAFLVNCIQCHGTGAAGSKGYANLNDDDWLWGGTLEDIYHTIAYGVRSDHPDTRYSEMSPFAGVLSRDQIVAIANYVLSLSNQPHDEALVAEGERLYNEPANCVTCHGEGGIGDRTIGAPRLNDAIVLKAGTLGEIVSQIENPKHGVMPAWAGRLSDTVIKELALYVYSLGGGEAATQ